MRLGVVAARQSELSAALLPRARESLDGPVEHAPEAVSPYLFVVSGPGIQNAEQTALSIGNDIEGLLSVGFCNGLKVDLSPGSIIVGGTMDEEASPHLLEMAARLWPYRVGRILTSDKAVGDRAERQRMADSGALGFDSISAGVGKAARQRSLPFLCVKVVIDTPAQPLASTYRSAGHVALELLKQPWSLGRIMRDSKHLKDASWSIRAFLDALGPQLAS